jgi:hypothetical protein
MQQHFWGLEGRKTWPTPHADYKFLARAVMEIGERRFGQNWTGLVGMPDGEQWDWVRGFLLENAGAVANLTKALSPNSSEFMDVDARAWADKTKTKSIFSRCQFTMPDLHPKQWGGKTVYADIYLDQRLFQDLLNKVPVDARLSNYSEFGHVGKSAYFIVLIEMAKDLAAGGFETQRSKTLEHEIAVRLNQRLNPKDTINEKLLLEEYAKVNGFSPAMVKSISKVLRGPDAKDLKGNMSKEERDEADRCEKHLKARRKK